MKNENVVAVFAGMHQWEGSLAAHLITQSAWWLLGYIDNDRCVNMEDDKTRRLLRNEDHEVLLRNALRFQQVSTPQGMQILMFPAHPDPDVAFCDINVVPAVWYPLKPGSKIRSKWESSIAQMRQARSGITISTAPLPSGMNSGLDLSQVLNRNQG